MFVEISRCKKWFLHLKKEEIEINYCCKREAFWIWTVQTVKPKTPQEEQHFSDYLLRSSSWFILFKLNIKKQVIFLFLITFLSVNTEKRTEIKFVSQAFLRRANSNIFPRLLTHNASGDTCLSCADLSISSSTHSCPSCLAASGRNHPGLNRATSIHCFHPVNQETSSGRIAWPIPPTLYPPG